MEKQKSSGSQSGQIANYTNAYTEDQVIGRGNFGAAMLVTHKKEGKKYIAKKINLEGLSAKEQEGCMMEVNLLKNLDHPNIVAYRESFLTSNQLIIVMEYCEVGDLAYHIKRKISKNEIFTELEVFNWFVQICLALEYVHGRRVIHRDIKTQNIFLTGNNTIKIGDFGISKVLETTCQNAQTVVGTPYYMAPEACQSEPYTSKSDVWALGCILYELCTLKKAFEADNLLGLVFKIVTDPIIPVPSNLPYSQTIRTLIDKLLEKNPKNRPSIAEILQMDMVQKKMQEFVVVKGQTLQSGTKVFNKQVPTLVVKPQVIQVDPNETPKERLARKKREEAERRAQEVADAAVKNVQQNNVAAKVTSLNQQQQHFGVQARPYLQPTKIQPQQQQVQQKSSGGQFFNPVDADDIFSRSYGDTISTKQSDGFFQPSDERQIHGAQQYNLDEIDFQEVHIQDNYQETEAAESHDALLDVIVKQYEQILNNKELESQKALQYEETTVRQDHQSKQQKERQRMDAAKLAIQKKLGEDLYDTVYSFLVHHRSQEKTDDGLMYQQLKEMMGDSKLLTEVFKLDGIVFSEIVLENKNKFR